MKIKKVRLDSLDNNTPFSWRGLKVTSHDYTHTKIYPLDDENNANYRVGTWKRCTYEGDNFVLHGTTMVEIEVKTTFADIPVGGIFTVGKYDYVKILPLICKSNAISCLDGSFAFFSDDSEVSELEVAG